MRITVSDCTKYEDKECDKILRHFCDWHRTISLIMTRNLRSYETFLMFQNIKLIAISPLHAYN
jgi:hypothetical protein